MNLFNLCNYFSQYIFLIEFKFFFFFFGGGGEFVTAFVIMFYCYG